METQRRDFIKRLAIGALSTTLSTHRLFPFGKSRDFASEDGINPWLEISKNAYLHNAAMISEMVGGKPILAVVKNNAYGIGDVEVAQILEDSPHVFGFALVKETRGIALRNAGVQKPILLMGDFVTDLGEDLVNAGITFSAFSEESVQKIINLPPHPDKKITVQLYFDTGLGRMGMPHDRPIEWVTKLAARPHIEITGLFSTLTSPLDFAEVQLQRFQSIANTLRKKGISTKRQHIAPSSSLLELPESQLDMVRPGILLHGSFPSLQMKQAEQYPLRPTFRLRAKVVRVEYLKKGDTIGFSRFYKVPENQWIATIPIGWADGYSGAAENGARVWINGKLYPVVNVNSSHCNVVIGSEKDVDVGEAVILIGPDAPEITPEGFARLIDGHNYLQINYKESLPKYVVDDFH